MGFSFQLIYIHIIMYVIPVQLSLLTAGFYQRTVKHSLRLCHCFFQGVHVYTCIHRAIFFIFTSSQAAFGYWTILRLQRTIFSCIEKNLCALQLLLKQNFCFIVELAKWPDHRCRAGLDRCLVWSVRPFLMRLGHWASDFKCSRGHINYHLCYLFSYIYILLLFQVPTDARQPPIG